MTWKEQQTERKRVEKEFERLEDSIREGEVEQDESFFGFVCDGCYKRIFDSRFRCRLCAKDEPLSFCRPCARDPKMSVMHKHEGGPRSQKGGAKPRKTAKGKARAGEDVVMTG